MNYIRDINQALRDTDTKYANGELSDYEYRETMWYLTTLEMHHMERVLEMHLQERDVE